MREGVYTLPVLHALHEGPDRDELQRLLATAPPTASCSIGRCEIVRGGGSIEHARAAVAPRSPARSALARQLPDGPARMH